MGRDLFDELPDEEIEFKTNKDYAKTYNKFRQKELLKKLKDREGSSSDSSSSTESDSSEEVVINPEFDQEFFKTLASLKSKDPKIYDKNTKFFEDIEGNKAVSTETNSKKKPFTLKDFERNVILKKGGIYEDDEEGSTEDKRPHSPSYAEEQRRLKAEFKNILGNDDNSDEEFGGIFRKREKTNAEKEKEDEQYLNWLAGKKDEIPDEVKERLNPLKQYWSKEDLPKPERFLRDYILNQGYIDKEDEEIPTYDQIVGEDLSEDEKELEKQAEFENKYNFRFEEPDQEFIKRYPRTIESSVRRKDEKRKRKREEIRERKRKEKEQKMQEIEKLKALKKKEIEEKIQKLKEVTGNDQLPFEQNDLEEDFNPELHDKKMKEIFNEEYYQIDEGEEKPECPDIEDLQVEDWDNFDPQNEEEDSRYNYEPHCEDDDFNMDCEYDPNSKDNFQNELIESTKDKKKRRKRRNRFMEMIKKEKPPFNPEDEKTYDEYVEEYYKMDCEDIIGDLPCRFKYVETVPNDFGLTIEEILLAKNKELNQWASLKKAIQIRSEKEEKRDVKLYRLKAKNEALKRKIFVSLYGPPSDEEKDIEINNCSKEHIGQSQVQTDKAKKKKRKRKKANSIDEPINQKVKKENQDNGSTNVKSTSKHKNGEAKQKSGLHGKENCSNDSMSSKKMQNEVKFGGKTKNQLKFSQSEKHKKCTSSITNTGAQISAERLQAYGINPKKFYKKQKFLNKLKKKSFNKKGASKKV